MDLCTAKRISEQLAALRAAAGGKAKSEAAAAWFDGEARYFLDLVGNTHRQWNITWATVEKAEPAEEAPPLPELLYEAEKRFATPTVTASRIKRLLADGWPENVLKAIVEKTLDAGITVQTIKKATGVRKVFTPSLCADWLKMSDKKRQKLLDSGVYRATMKMDGLRALFFLNMPNEGAYSRNLKPLKNLEKHLAALKPMFPEPCVVDGEILSASNSWNDSVTGVRKSGSKVAMVYHIFDWIPAEEIEAQDYKLPAYKRWLRVKKGLPVDTPMFVRVKHYDVKTIRDVENWHLRAVQQGWEGLVLQDMTAPYACKRSSAWVKVKQFLSSEFTITGFVQGTGKHRGRLGTIVVEGEYEGKTYKTEVGTGFDDQQREEIWSNQSKYLGKTVEVKFFGYTEGALRFPVFLRLREAE